MSYLHRFSVFVWINRNYLITLLEDAYVFEKGEKNLHFQRYPDMCVRGLKVRACCETVTGAIRREGRFGSKQEDIHKLFMASR